MEFTAEQALQKGIDAQKAGRAQEDIPIQYNILDELKLDKALKLAKNKVKDGLSNEAKKIYHDILKKFPKNKKALDGMKKLASRTLADTSDMKGPPKGRLNSLLTLYNQQKLQQVFNEAQILTKRYTKSLILWNLLGASAAQIGKLDEAIFAFKKALLIKPDSAGAYNNMGNAIKNQGKLEEAIEAYKKALSINPDYAEAYLNMGNALKNQGKLEEAIEAYKKALSINPDYAEAYNNLGVTLKEQGKLEQALEIYNKATLIKPDYADPYYNKAAILQDQGKPDEAIEAYNKTINIEPNNAEAHQNLSFVLLNSGRLKEGLDEYEWRWKTANRVATNRYFSQPLWDGKKSLKGKKILIWSEQGVGDTINWSSCLSLVAKQAKHCILECEQKLVSLLARSLPNIEVRPQNRNLESRKDDFDFHIPMGSLFRHFTKEISSNYARDAFLIPDPVRVKFWRKRLKSLGKGPYIGISWKSSNMSPMRLPNYALISELYPVLKMPDITLINLQYKDFEDDLCKIEDEIGVKVHNFDDLDHFENLEDVAALSAALDIIVSTHNVLVMIAPGVGTPTKFASWRQSSWSNILFSPKGPAIDKFERNTWQPWEEVFRSIAENIMENNPIQ